MREESIVFPLRLGGLLALNAGTSGSPQDYLQNLDNIN